MGFFQGPQERVRNSRGKQATEVLLYSVNCPSQVLRVQKLCLCLYRQNPANEHPIMKRNRVVAEVT